MSCRRRTDGSCGCPPVDDVAEKQERAPMTTLLRQRIAEYQHPYDAYHKTWAAREVLSLAGMATAKEAQDLGPDSLFRLTDLVVEDFWQTQENNDGRT